MVVVTTHFTNTTTTWCKPVSPLLQFFHQIYGNPRRPSCSWSKVPNNCNGVVCVRAYMENPNSISSFASKVIGSLPVVGLLARILSDEGGVGGDIIDFAEFRRRVGKSCSVADSKAFYDFKDRRGPLWVLGSSNLSRFWRGVARLRISDDIEFEEETFLSMINEAKERRAKSKVAAPTIPMEIRAEKALEAIYVCCFRKDPIREEDKRLLNIMLSAVFRSVEQSKIQRIVEEKVRRVAEGGDENYVEEPKPLPKEAVQLQMKDLEFLKQNRET
ncbi:photosystem I assembly factor PSA3, chloroplastic [Fagus crenata]